jgi:hypothetical protein
MNAPAQRQTDPLSERLGRLRTARRDPGWAQELLELGRELTMAEAGVVLARAPAGWEAIAPRTGDDPPEAWSSLAGEAADGRGIAAGRAGPDGRWVFAVAIGAADQAARPAVLVLQVAASIAMDLVLTRERMAFLGALAEAAGAEAAAQARAPLTLAAAVAEAMLKPADRQEGLHQAAALLHAAGLPGAERVAIVLPRAGTLALSDQAQHDAGAELPRRLMALAQEATDRGAPRRAMPGEAPTPAERSFAERFGPRPLIIVPRAGRARGGDRDPSAGIARGRWRRGALGAGGYPAWRHCGWAAPPAGRSPPLDRCGSCRGRLARARAAATGRGGGGAHRAAARSRADGDGAFSTGSWRHRRYSRATRCGATRRRSRGWPRARCSSSSPPRVRGWRTTCATPRWRAPPGSRRRNRSPCSRPAGPRPSWPCSSIGCGWRISARRRMASSPPATCGEASASR